MTTGRKLLFSITVTAVFFVVAEGLLVLIGVTSRGFVDDPYVGFTGSSRLFIEEQVAGSVRLKTSDAKVTLFNVQEFPKNKKDAFRVFCVGGSTTFGRPYDDATSFCGWLRELLPIADPTRRWEVINAGGVSYASYRVAMLMEELIDYEPDLFIVYSGHNEFLEQRSYSTIISTPPAVRGLGSIVSKTRLWTAMSELVRSISGGRAAPESNPDLLSGEVKTLLDGAVGPSAYTRDDDLAKTILQHFRFNLARMVDIGSSVGAGTVLITPASNLRDSRPFKTEHRDDLSEEDRRRFDQLVADARVARSEGDPRRTVELIAAAAAIDPRHAQLAYLQGRLLAEAGELEAARAAFERARDQDICPLRAVDPIPEIVREVGRERGTTVVDFEQLADRWADGSIPGADLFLDHVHPTIAVHRRLAVSVIEEMAVTGTLNLDTGWTPDAVAEIVRRIEDSIDPLTHALALMKLSKVLGWAGKMDESFRLGMQAAELYPDDSRIQYNAGLTAHLVGQKDRAVAHYLRAIELQPDADEPHGNLGVLLEEAGMLDRAIAHYRSAIRYARSPETAQRNRANLAEALMKAGYESYQRGQREQALAQLTEAASIAPTDPEILSRLGVAQLASGMYDGAVKSFQGVLRSRTDDAVATNRLALAEALNGQPQRAAELYARAQRLDPAVERLPDNLFRVLGNLGRDDLAAEIRRRMGE